ncbi:hypothetical protein ACKWTF_006776 [Chironomus riparius]
MDLQIKFNTSEGTARKVSHHNQFGELVTIQLENLSNRQKLSEIVRAIVTEYKSIIGAIRVADYNQKLLDSVVFLQFHDRNEARQLLNLGSLYLFGQLVRITNPFLVHGRVPFSFNYNAEEEAPSNGIPVPMAVFKLNDKVESNTTIHLIKVLESFEFHAAVTSFRFAFNHKRHRIRSFGAITFLNRRDALNSQKQEHYIIGNKLDIKVPRSFPVLLHNSLAGLLTNGQAEFSSMVSDNNWYHANLMDLSRPKNPVPTTMEVNSFPDVADIPLPPEPEPQIVQQSSRQLLDEAFAIANIGQEISRLNSNFFFTTPPASSVLSIGGDENFDELIKEDRLTKRQKLN